MVDNRHRNEVPVVDPAELAAVAEWVNKQKGHGIPYATMWRLRNAVATSISRETFERLFHALMARRNMKLRVRFERAVMPPGAGLVETVYIHWTEAVWGDFLGRQLDRWEIRDGRFAQVDSDSSIGAPLELPHLLDELRGAAVARYENYEALLHRIASLPIGQELERWESRQEKRLDYDEGAARVNLAVFQMLRPLLESPDSGLVERSWEEMPDAALIAYVRAGLKQMTILLDRLPMRARIREIAAGQVPAARRRRPLPE